MVTADTSGNIARPPNRSVSAPTGMRPREPTTTGAATRSADSNDDRASSSWNLGPSGLSSAHAQQFTAKPSVARASINQARPGTGAGAVLSVALVDGFGMPSSSSSAGCPPRPRTVRGEPAGGPAGGALAPSLTR